jgi:hypothetical protein
VKPIVLAVALATLSACKSNPPADGAPPTSSAAPEGTGKGKGQSGREEPPPMSTAPIAFSIADAGGAEITKLLETLTGKASKIDPDAEPILNSVKITITNADKVEPKVAVKQLVDALKAKGLDLEEGSHKWKIHRAK